ncbi:peptide chain release factor 1 [Peloplasma aerotolerans]|uniref:Peptide chain release factor 1 n=1 Tax=Peloplasma aerotolerans TaxID=3044389 RepID=A0AAW6UBC4_9MOLU|nr:peptide chain release factor 1 [Mariniplasma sp. M4Ah]MDI6453498.1 peptide chain release factor 1 [Mariniplasma sp. M4Ah]
MFERLEILEKQYQEMQDKLASGKLEVKEMTNLLKESSAISETVETYRFFKNKSQELKDLEEMIEDESDHDLIDMANTEIDKLKNTLEKTEEKLKILLLPTDPNDEKNVIMEIKGAAGGDEGNIFAGDLFRMYSKYAESKGWKIEILSSMEGSMGGYTSIEFMITGKRIYSFLKYESGTHRVQRVPETESMGRVHTSTATVLVMPEAEEIELDIKWEDIRFDTYNSSGPGGQSVNTTKSAVRLTHIPSGLVVACQEGKSQHENKDKAFRLLKTRLFDSILQEQMDKEGAERKALIGRGDRSEKIRTYNYPQNRVSDHRIGLTLQRLDAVMEGRLDLIIEPLLNEFQKRMLTGEEL